MSSAHNPEGWSPSHRALADPDSVNVLGVKVHAVSLERLLDIIEQTIMRHERALITHLNVRAANLAYDHLWFRAFLNQSNVVFCDGFGVKWGARLLGRPLPERITYADWMWSLAAFAAPRGFTFYFLGARPGVAEKAARQLQARFPTLRIAGVQHGYFDKTLGSAENAHVIRDINTVRPHILVLGFGMPVQERWLMDHWSELEANVALTGGAVFDYLSGELKRGPRWMTDHGFEWLARLIIEPRRLWKRYLVGNPLFLWRVLKQRSGLLRLRD